MYESIYAALVARLAIKWKQSRFRSSALAFSFGAGPFVVALDRLHVVFFENLQTPTMTYATILLFHLSLPRKTINRHY